jgi:hypothetical protein
MRNTENDKSASMRIGFGETDFEPAVETSYPWPENDLVQRFGHSFVDRILGTRQFRLPVSDESRVASNRQHN